MYRYWLANIPGMTPSKYEFIYRNCSCAEELYMLSDRAIEKMTGLSQKDAQSIILSRKNWNLQQKWQELMESGAGFVSWEDIQEILLRSMLGNVFIELVIKDEQRYLNNMTLMQRLCAQANKKMGHEIICMTLNTTGKNPHEVFKIAQVYFKEYLKTQE